jgi:hypothetical protein
MRTSFICVGALIALAGCSGGQSRARAESAPTLRSPAPNEQTPRSPAPLASEPRDRTVESLSDRLGATTGRAGNCPLELAATAVVAEQTTDGAALAFTTTESVVELRRRVAALVKTELAMLPQARVRTDNVEHGVRLVFVPVRAGDLDALRERIRERSEQILESCPRMQIAHVRGEDGEQTPETEREPTAGESAKDEPVTPSILDQQASEPGADDKPDADEKPDESKTEDQDQDREGDDQSEEKDGQEEEEDEEPRPPMIEDGGDGLVQPSSSRPLR